MSRNDAQTTPYEKKCTRTLSLPSSLDLAFACVRMLLFFASNDIVVEIVKDRALIAVEMNRRKQSSLRSFP